MKTDTKTDKHPKMKPVIFRDSSEGGGSYLIYSTAETEVKEMAMVNGEETECSVFNVNISSKTHPFCSGEFGALTDTDNKIKDFNSKFGMFT